MGKILVSPEFELSRVLPCGLKGLSLVLISGWKSLGWRIWNEDSIVFKDYRLVGFCALINSHDRNLLFIFFQVDVITCRHLLLTWSSGVWPNDFISKLTSIFVTVTNTDALAFTWLGLDHESCLGCHGGHHFPSRAVKFSSFVWFFDNLLGSFFLFDQFDRQREEGFCLTRVLNLSRLQCLIP